MAGVISVGFGDTAASIIGSKFGVHHVPLTSSKSVEGSIAGIVAQFLLLPVLIYCGFVRWTTLTVAKYLVAITTSTLTETFTDQIDNLVLPFVTFILLSI